MTVLGAIFAGRLAGTSSAVVRRLNTELNRILVQPEVRKLLLDQGFEPAATTPEQFARVIRVQIVKWSKVTQAAGLRPGD